MNRFSDFLKSGFGRSALLVVGIIALVFTFSNGCHPAQQPALIPASTNASTLQVTDTSGSIPAAVPPPVRLTNAPKPKVILTIDVELPVNTNAIPTVYAPPVVPSSAPW